MPQGYYTLEEAAQVLNMSSDELRQMAQKDEIRSFQDRGTLRFRVEDIQEMSRIRSGRSDPDLVLGEPSIPTSADSPAPKSPNPKSETPDVFGFDLDDDEADVDFGIDLGEQSGASPKSGVLTPRPGSDSDVKLVGGGSDDFALSIDSDPGAKKDLPSNAQVKRDTEVKLSDERKSEIPSTPRVDKKSPSGPQLDSGVRLVSLDSDSDVKIVPDSSDEIPLGDMPPRSAADSDVRLEEMTSPKPSSEKEMLKTEEIRLDELDSGKWETEQSKKQSKVQPTEDLPVFSEESPFEISESDTPNVPSESQSLDKSSGEFELSIDDSDDEMLLGDSSDDFNLELPDDDEIELSLDDSGADLQGPSSGINLNKPDDSGISLEEEGSEPDFELSLDEPTPKPAAASKEPDSDSEFELSLDLEDSGIGMQGDSDSEFELTLDDSGELEGDKPQAKADDQDVFETDFEVPALDDESGSEVAALETDLDSSDFELALDDSDLSLEEEESGSQVVALDEEDADAAADTLQTTEEPEIDVLEDEFDIEEDDFDDEGAPDFGGIEEEAPDEEVEATVREVVVKEKVSNPPWGVMPMIFMLPCVVLMVVIGLMGYELIQSANGYGEPGFLTKHLSDLILKK